MHDKVNLAAKFDRQARWIGATTTWTS